MGKGFNKLIAQRARQAQQATGGGGKQAAVDTNQGVYATAPYNFITCNGFATVPAATEGPTYSGAIHCSLTTLSPLLVGGPQERGDKNKAKNREFFKIGGKYVIPGTSLKGMLRSFVEILSFSAMRPVSKDKIFWRNVTGDGSSEYKKLFPENPEGGWLVQEGSRYKFYPVTVTPLERIDKDKDPWPSYATGAMTIKGDKCPTKKCYKFEEKNPNHFLPVPKAVADEFFAQMTEAQENNWKKERNNLKGKGARVFCTRDKNGQITHLGTARYFRIPYDKTPADLVGNVPDKDFATHLFGTVQGKVQRGRLAFTQATFAEGAKLFRPAKEEDLTVVLGQPHPSCLMHYLDQSHLARSGNIHRDQHRTYDHGAAVLRGRKYYWHRDFEPVRPPVNKTTGKPNPKVSSILHPLASGEKATFTVWLDSLTEAELGALLKALELPKGHAHKLGLGKSMGLGSVRLDITGMDIHEDRKQYASLAGRLAKTGETPSPQMIDGWKKAFEAHVCKHLNQGPSYANLQAIRELYSMTNFAGKPANEKTRNMDLKEFRNYARIAPVLEIRPN